MKLYLTASRVGSANQCGRRYFNEYVAKKQKDKQGFYFDHGSADHHSLDHFHRDNPLPTGPVDLALEGWKNTFKNKDILNMVTEFACVLEKAFASDKLLAIEAKKIEKARPELKNVNASKEYKEAKESLYADIQPEIDRLMKWDFMIRNDEFFPYNMASTATICKNFTKSVDRMKLYLAHYCSLEFKPEILELETYFKKTEIGEFTIGAKIDKVQVQEDGSTEIVDYKTGAVSDNPIELINQAITYYFVVKHHLQIEADRVVFHYLDDCSFKKIIIEDRHLDFLLEQFNYVKHVCDNELFGVRASYGCRNCDWKDDCFSEIQIEGVA